MGRGRMGEGGWGEGGWGREDGGGRMGRGRVMMQCDSGRFFPKAVILYIIIDFLRTRSVSTQLGM